MRNPFRKKRKLPVPDPDNDPIAITHEQDPSLDKDEMVIYTTIDPESINRKKEQ